MTRLIPHREVLDEELRDPEMREWYERTALAREVARAVLAYRIEHGLTQRALAAQLGVKQPAVARLEDGETTPSMATLIHVARTLGLEFSLEVGAEVSVSVRAAAIQGSGTVEMPPHLAEAREELAALRGKLPTLRSHPEVLAGLFQPRQLAEALAVAAHPDAGRGAADANRLLEVVGLPPERGGE